MQIDTAVLRSKIMGTLTASFSEEHATAIADYLLWAEMSGNRTQGILKLTGSEPLQDVKPKGPIAVERDTKLSQRIDAGAHPAILVSSMAADRAIAKAKEHGFAILGVRNTYSSNGAQAYYVDRIAKNDLIGIMCSRSPSSTAGFGSIDPLFGTNPIGFGFPTNDSPVVFDMATSAITFYGLILAEAKGEKIPEDVAIDADGNLTTDPAKAMHGAILPFDKGYKGAGIGMVVEILTGPLIASAYIDNKTFKEEWGTLIIAIDPALLVDTDAFKEHCSALVNKIKSSRKKSIEEIRLPGERARACYEKCLQSGKVDVDEAVLRQLKYL